MSCATWATCADFSPRPAISESAADASGQPGHFLDLLASSQSRRLDEQRASAGSLPGLRLDQRHSQDVLSKLMASADSAEPEEDFFDMLIKCQVGGPDTKDVVSSNCLVDLVEFFCAGIQTRWSEMCSSTSSDQRPHSPRRRLLQSHPPLPGQKNRWAASHLTITPVLTERYTETVCRTLWPHWSCDSWVHALFQHVRH